MICAVLIHMITKLTVASVLVIFTNFVLQYMVADVFRAALFNEVEIKSSSLDKLLDLQCHELEFNVNL